MASNGLGIMPGPSPCRRKADRFSRIQGRTGLVYAVPVSDLPQGDLTEPRLPQLLVRQAVNLPSMLGYLGQDVLGGLSGDNAIALEPEVTTVEFLRHGDPSLGDIEEAYNVTTTNFVPRSFETIEAAQPSVLIIDLVLGEQAGWDLLVQLRRAASTRDIPVILISTSPRLLTNAHDEHREFGGDHFLLKPFDLEDLLLIIEELIGTA